MSTGSPLTADELLNLAWRLRNDVPSETPMDLAEQVRHTIVRLELLARRQPLPDDAAAAFAMGEALLKSCARFALPRP